MMNSATGGDGQNKPVVIATPGHTESCPKCHARLEIPARRPAPSMPARSAWSAPRWLRASLHVLLLATLACPAAAVYYLHSRAEDETVKAAREAKEKAAATAQDYLSQLGSKDASAAKKMMTENGNRQQSWSVLRSILETTKPDCQITETKFNGQLIDVMVTLVLPDDAKLPTLPIEVDKNPKVKLVLGQKNGQWLVDSVSLIPKDGINMPPKGFGPQKRIKPSGGM